MGFMRTNYRIPRGDPATSWIHNLFESTIIWGSTGVVSSAGYLVITTGYGRPSHLMLFPVSQVGRCGSVKGDANDSTIYVHAFGPGSFDTSVIYATVLVRHDLAPQASLSPAGTMSVFGAVDAYDTATPSTSTSIRVIYIAIIGSL